MKNFILFFLALGFPNLLLSQNIELVYSHENFSTLFEDGFREFQRQFDPEFFGESSEGINFLINRIESDSWKVSKSVALSHLRWSKDERAVGVLSSYLNENLYFKTAISSLLKIHSRESISALEVHLSSLSSADSEKALIIIRALSKSAFISSVSFIQDYNKKLANNHELNNEITAAINDIQIFNLGYEEAINLVRTKLFSGDRNKIMWCIVLLNLNPDEKFLKVIKEYDSSLEESIESKTIRNYLLILREKLGDDVYNSKEKTFLSERNKTKTERRKRTLELFSK